jgi:hypothetical protein
MSTDLYITGTYNDTSFVLYNADGTLSNLPGLANTTNSNTQDIFLVKYNTNGFAQWGTRLGGDTYSGSGCLVVDSCGNVYITGSYNDTSFVLYNADGSQSDVPPLANTTNTNTQDPFVVKYDKNGTALWATRLGNNIQSGSWSIAVDSLGNVYITGQYSSTTPFLIYDSCGNAPLSLSPTNTYDVFVIKYSTHGYPQWATRLESMANISATSLGYSIAVDTSGNVYITGRYRGGPFIIYDANGTSSIPSLESTVNNTDTSKRVVFFVKYNANGYAQWATRLGGTTASSFGSNPTMLSLDIDSNIYITGIYSDSTFVIYDACGNQSHLPGLAHTPTQVSGNVYNTFIVKYNPNGLALWGTRLGGNSSSFGNAISVDPRGNVYITGSYSDTSFNIYDACGNNAHLPALIDNDNDFSTDNVFVVKYDTNGFAQWGTRLCGNNTSYGQGIEVDPYGNVYITGGYNDTSFVLYNADGSQSDVPPLANTTNSNTEDTFIVKYDTNGYAQWATRLGGDARSNGVSIAINRFAYPSPQLCFLEGSKLLCLIDGEEIYKKIEEIKKDTLIKTGNSGYKKVEMIGHSKMYNPGNKIHSKSRLYVCKKEHYPELTEDLIITGCHSILVNELSEEERERSIEYTGKIYITENKYRLIACLDKRAEPYEKEGIHTIWHLALEHENYYMNYGCYANGLLVETTSKRMMKELSGMEMA